jgi:hypothetical protein
LVLLEQFEHPLAAHSCRILLEANGIPSVVDGDSKIEGFELTRLYVHRKNKELAIRVVKEVPAASEVMIPAWICSCGEEVDEGFAICWSCGNEVQDEGQG